MNFMVEIKLIIIIITFVTTIVDYIIPMLDNRFNVKPLNCSFCLSVWISLLIVLFVWEWWVILATPLCLRIIERRLL